MINEIEKQLDKQALSLNQFSELLSRLLDFSLLFRDDSQIEQILYDRFLRIQPLVEDYFSLSGIRLYHDSRFKYVRLFPPAAQIPGVEQTQQSAFLGGMKARLSQNEVALILVLRALYDKAIREGDIDESANAVVNLEKVAIAMKNMLNRSLPEQMADIKMLFKRLKQLRLLHLQSENQAQQAQQQQDIWLMIRPSIIQFVSEDVLNSLQGQTDEIPHKLAQSQVTTTDSVAVTTEQATPQQQMLDQDQKS